MNKVQFSRSIALLLSFLILAFCCQPCAAAAPAPDQHFDVLQVGTRSYTNVTVTTKAKTYIFISHSAGLTTVKLSDVSEEVREQLGYTPEVKPKSKAEVAEDWAKKNIASLPQVQRLETEFRESIATDARVARVKELLNPTTIAAAVGVITAIYLFFSYCLYLICKKTGQKPGALIWIPVLQLFPMLRAAGMSGWWFVAWFVPVLQLLPQILWCLKIAEARGKRIWTAVALMLPVTNLFAFLYLAFSAGAKQPDRFAPRAELMTLETA